MLVVTFFITFRGPQASGVGRTDVLLAQIQFFSGIGWGMLLFALAAKVQVVVMPVFEERKFLENIQKYKVRLDSLLLGGRSIILSYFFR